MFYCIFNHVVSCFSHPLHLSSDIASLPLLENLNFLLHIVFASSRSGGGRQPIVRVGCTCPVQQQYLKLIFWAHRQPHTTPLSHSSMSTRHLWSIMEDKFSIHPSFLTLIKVFQYQAFGSLGDDHRHSLTICRLVGFVKSEANPNNNMI